jgi:hypothetical protein
VRATNRWFCGANVKRLRSSGWGSRLPQFLQVLRHRDVSEWDPDWGSGLPQPNVADSVHISYMATDPHSAESLERLPLPYATALRLRNTGVADEVIAERVGVDLDALPTFMRVAEAKLAAASEEPPT